MKNETDWHTHKRGNHVLRTKIEYGFMRLGNQAPYFSLTHTTERRPSHGGRWSEDSGGVAGHEVLRHFPKIAPLQRWHLTSTDGPMHYAPNGIYWWEIATGRRPMSSGSPDPIDAFSRTVILGALPGEVARAQLVDEGTPGHPAIGLRVRKTAPSAILSNREQVEKFLTRRSHSLLKTMEDDMQRAGIQVPR